MYSSQVIGSKDTIKLDNGSEVHYINFDNAATTPPFKTVIKDIVDFSPNYSSVHRGSGYKSVISSKVYDEGRNMVLDFVKGNKNYHTVIFLKNTTECINKLSYRLKDSLEDKLVLSTYMEHHSNLLPWKYRFDTDYIDVDKYGRLSMEDLEDKLKKYDGKVGLVTVTGASNVTGYINPIHDMAKICHKYGAKILVDGAQLIPHSNFDMKPVGHPEHIDYLAFSGHKMYAPFGVGALVAPKEIFKEGHSEHIGGGTIDFVSMEDVIWAEPPEKEEAGTPNLMGVVALSSSIKKLEDIGMENIEEYERDLTRYAIEKLKNIPNLILYDDFDIDNKVSIISFNMKGLDHEDLATILGREGGIGVRNGCFCAQPYVQRLLNISDDDMEKYKVDQDLARPGLVRISFGLYNTYDEIYLLYYLLNQIGNNIEYYRKNTKYINI
ncbi:aminotransferase class V-fold PLP-dependent enzyme [Wansuia hejianensis]|uniref:Aminotransferase class V-fold PLP-dependent enzyme n=1 Tax=Wansuia hejianensis TaxID=2763667 RepID=A0A926ILM6_9FIRM|nr:aminotransferase class V-fold PLP-dependent enzyme [Wansuia hejianensis]MBC8589711.1 aminotransferase class V-fold PLP-dependent enzyme [Wansuia hejianensis]